MEPKNFDNYDQISNRHTEADLERKKRDFKILIILIFVILLSLTVLFLSLINKNNDSVPASASIPVTDTSSVKHTDEQTPATSTKETDSGHKTEIIDGRTYIDGVLIVNKSYPLPSSYDPGMNEEASAAFEKMQAAASEDGLFLYILSGYRSYSEQQYQYNVHVKNKGKEYADKVSARPGYSEHQSGLCMDINSTEDSFADTKEAAWLAENCTKFGFIIRFPKGKEKQTGYNYEPWHIRYVGIQNAQEIAKSGLCLEEYLGVKSEYSN